MNPNKGGVVPVGVLSTDAFDATLINPLSVTFGPGGAGASHGLGHVQDLNGDEILEILFHFEVPEAGIGCGESSATINGELLNGTPIIGNDLIHTVGCK